jgi:ADP-ribosylglycohydrolase
MSTPTADYIHRRTAQINAALSGNDANTVAVIVGLIRGDGHHALANEIMRDLAEQGVRVLAEGR